MTDRYPTPEELRSHIGLRETILLWISMIGAPVIWFLQFQLNYSLVLWACRNNKPYVLTASFAVFDLMCICVGLLALRNWRRYGRRWPGSGFSADARSGFMSLIGLLLSSLFTLVILAQMIATFFLSPCPR
jgi:hypothetical protein